VLALIEEIVDWLGPLFESWGYLVIAVAVLLERSILLGLVVPGDIIIALGGIYAAQGELSLPWVIVIAAVAAIAGESIGFWLGDRYGQRLIRRLPLVNRLEHRIDAASAIFRKRSAGWAVAIGRYATAAGAMVPFTAGMGKMRYRTFLAYDVPAIVIWAVGITLVGYVFGNNLDTVEKILSRFGWGILGLIVLLIAFRIFWKKTHPQPAPSSETPPEVGSGPADGSS
jgi:undecaprenyl-diphosphatase